MKFQIRKNSLPYIQPYSIIDENGSVVGNYKTIAIAKEAQLAIESGYKASIKKKDQGTAFDKYIERMNNKDGDPVPTAPTKKIRRVIIDED